ncbi:helix-turn-helix domain-containing protein [Streptomyces canus]|uniref:Crp/Fnr family transcriptional regulator n=1 Tax=Streptomyces canus TaxID=58343 RepID=UPI0033A86D23
MRPYALTSSGSSPPRPAPSRNGSPTRPPSPARPASQPGCWTGSPGTEPDGHVPLPGGQRELADLLGVTRVTVNRALSRLRRDGIVGPMEKGGGRIPVLAPELLALRAAQYTRHGR